MKVHSLAGAPVLRPATSNVVAQRWRACGYGQRRRWNEPSPSPSHGGGGALRLRGASAVRRPLSAIRTEQQQQTAATAAAADPFAEQGSSSSSNGGGSAPPPAPSVDAFAPSSAEQQQPQQQQYTEAAVPTPPMPPRLPADILGEFRAEFVAELSSATLTLTAVTGVIVYWRGVWSLLDYALGDSPIADAACIAGGLLAVVGVRLSGRQVSDSFF